jgi:hypothetical protein
VNRLMLLLHNVVAKAIANVAEIAEVAGGVTSPM